jgi:hypothetical protein
MTSVTLGRTPLSSLETQSLRSHPLYLLFKSVDLFFMPNCLRFCVCLAQFIERLLNGEFRGFGHGELLSNG